MPLLPRRHLLALSMPIALAAAALAPLHTAAAQSGAGLDAKAAAQVRDHYLADLDTVHAKIVALATAIPAEKYSWRPAQGVRSVSEVLMHVASEWSYYLPLSIGAKPPADFGSPRETLPKLEKITGKAQVLDELARAWTYGRAQLVAANPAQLTGNYKPWGMSLDAAAFSMTDDQHEHLGQLIAYARSVGVKPPWSK